MHSATIPVVWAIIQHYIDSTPHVLLQTTRKHWTEYHQKLETPVWWIEQRENVYTALDREVKEECWLTVTHINVQERSFGMHSQAVSPYLCVQQCAVWLPWILLGFVCRAEWTLVHQDSESRDPHRVTHEQLRMHLEQGDIFDLEVPLFMHYLSTYESITFEPFDDTFTRLPTQLNP